MLPEGRCAATVLTARYNAKFHQRQLYAAAVVEDKAINKVPPDTLLHLICESLIVDPIVQEARLALGRPGGNLPNEHTVTAPQLGPDQTHKRQHNGLLYYWAVLYVPGASGACTDVLCHYYDYPLARHLGSRNTLDLVARMYYWSGMSCDIKAY
jgi:hypothetical protein